MIARIWHGVVPETKADAYYDYMDKTGFTNYRKTPGFVDLKVLRSNKEGLIHYLIITYWESNEAIRKFAGNDCTKAQYYPEDKEFLIEFEEFVNHYEVVNPDK